MVLSFSFFAYHCCLQIYIFIMRITHLDATILEFQSEGRCGTFAESAGAIEVMGRPAQWIRREIDGRRLVLHCLDDGTIHQRTTDTPAASRFIDNNVLDPRLATRQSGVVSQHQHAHNLLVQTRGKKLSVRCLRHGVKVRGNDLFRAKLRHERGYLSALLVGYREQFVND